MTSESTRFLGQPSETKPTVGVLAWGESGDWVSGAAPSSSVEDRLTVLILAGPAPTARVKARGRAALLDAVGQGWGRNRGGRLGRCVAGDDHAVGFEVGDAVVGGVPEHHGFAEYLEVAAGVVGEVAADGVVIGEDEDVRGFALGAVDGVLQPAMEGGGRKRGGGVGAGTDGGDDHKGRDLEIRDWGLGLWAGSSWFVLRHGVG